jgi:hypothetical protein
MLEDARDVVLEGPADVIEEIGAGRYGEGENRAQSQHGCAKTHPASLRMLHMSPEPRHHLHQ